MTNESKVTSPGELWQDRGGYFYLPHKFQKQGMAKLGGKFITGGKHAATLGLLGPEEKKKVIDYMLTGKRIEVFDQRMADLGLKAEPMLREWYDKTITPLEREEEKIAELGPAIPKDAPYLLDVADARTKDGKGVVEFKTRKYISSSLAAGKIPLKDYIQLQDHIHAYQVEYCDYVVYAWKTNTIFYRRVFRDLEYYKSTLKPGSEEVIRNELKEHSLYKLLQHSVNSVT